MRHQTPSDGAGVTKLRWLAEVTELLHGVTVIPKTWKLARPVPLSRTRHLLPRSEQGRGTG